MTQVRDSKYQNKIKDLRLKGDLESIVEKNLPIDDLIATQCSLFASKLNNIEGEVDSEKYPILVIEQENGYKYVQEGHHRAYLAYWQGQEEIKAVYCKTRSNTYSHNRKVKGLNVHDDSNHSSKKVKSGEFIGLCDLF